MAIDAWGWDMPLHLQAQNASRENRPGVFWATHQIDAAYSHMERLVNLGPIAPLRIQSILLSSQNQRRQRISSEVVAILPE